ncbi:nuclear transport factor 2 family protein [Paraglaciecola aquimarina]|uniref:Nuclear transport factor 2 family protein n=1 Tax=Paraglaciecola algarum TaxID=3050085 RepID=A0ABS9D599_9ALTE|nr:nuclear transport factor 2 family protein [Paraglaciecola sp. G1-23]MCF2948051.1 nuclear transport factor 2 family protein [Paraglaciecola sp. G1-23]
MNNQDFQTVTAVLQDYFEGLHQANTKRLSQICVEELVLSSPNLRRSRKEWFELIMARPIPQVEGHPFNYKILSLDVIGDQAMAKLSCPLLGSEYIDFIGLLKENGEWKIINKMYVDLIETN